MSALDTEPVIYITHITVPQVENHASVRLFVVPDLRKQARQLENELDLKLVSFSKLCTSYSSSRDGRRGET